jgi:L(+)-tartrate dehydratase alpha subunit
METLNNEVTAQQKITETVGKFIGLIGKRLPDDVGKRLVELEKEEVAPLSKVVYQSMMDNQDKAMKLNRPSCQDTGVIQFFIKCGSNFPFIGDLEEALTNSVLEATKNSPLRHNSVETFDEYNTGKNIGKGHHPSSGILFRTATNWNWMSTWQAVVAHCRANQWY